MGTMIITKSGAIEEAVRNNGYYVADFLKDLRGKFTKDFDTSSHQDVELDTTVKAERYKSIVHFFGVANTAVLEHSNCYTGREVYNSLARCLSNAQYFWGDGILPKYEVGSIEYQFSLVVEDMIFLMEEFITAYEACQILDDIYQLYAGAPEDVNDLTVIPDVDNLAQVFDEAAGMLHSADSRW